MWAPAYLGWPHFPAKRSGCVPPSNTISDAPLPPGGKARTPSTSRGFRTTTRKEEQGVLSTNRNFKTLTVSRRCLVLAPQRGWGVRCLRLRLRFKIGPTAVSSSIVSESVPRRLAGVSDIRRGGVLHAAVGNEWKAPTCGLGGRGTASVLLFWLVWAGGEGRERLRLIRLGN